MNNLVNLTYFSNHSNNRDWFASARVRELLELLSGYAQIGLTPDKLDAGEEGTIAIDTLSNERIEHLWEYFRGGIFERESPWHMELSVDYTPDDRVLDSASLWIDAGFFDEETRTAEFLNLAKQLYEWRGIVYGYVAHYDEYKGKTRNWLSSPGHIMKTALPGMFWANFFGPLYVSWLGEESFETVEAYHKEQLPDGGWLLVTRPNVLKYRNFLLRAHEMKIMAHLGRYAFFENLFPYKPTRAPESLVSTEP